MFLLRRVRRVIDQLNYLTLVSEFLRPLSGFPRAGLTYLVARVSFGSSGPCTSGWPAKATTNTATPTPGCTSRAAAPAVRPPRCCAASSPTTTTAPTPLTTSPPTSTRNSSPPGWASLLERPTHAVQARRATYCRWQEQTQDMLAEQQRWIEQHI